MPTGGLPDISYVTRLTPVLKNRDSDQIHYRSPNKAPSDETLKRFIVAALRAFMHLSFGISSTLSGDMIQKPFTWRELKTSPRLQGMSLESINTAYAA